MSDENQIPIVEQQVPEVSSGSFVIVKPQPDLKSWKVELDKQKQAAVDQKDEGLAIKIQDWQSRVLIKQIELDILLAKLADEFLPKEGV